MAQYSQNSSFRGPIRNNFAFKTEWWEDADGAYRTEHEKFIFLKTIMDYGSQGIIPKNCDCKENLQTDDDRIRWSALVKCADYISQHDEYSKRGKKGASARWCSDSRDTDGQLPAEEFPIERDVADIKLPINTKANIRCKNVSELKGWFDKFKQNARMIVLQGFSGSDEDWNDLFEYLDNNDWKKSHGKEYVVWGNFPSTVKWAWTGVKERRKMSATKVVSKKEDDVETPGDSLRREDDLRRRMIEKFGA